MLALSGRMEAFARRLARRKRVLFLLDFDGTLCEIKPRPGQAMLDAEGRMLLGRLNAGAGRVAVVSGRSFKDLKRRVGVKGIVFCANFGLEMRGGGWRFLHPGAPRLRGLLSDLEKNLASLSSDMPGASVEAKGWGLALHHRGMSDGRLKDLQTRLARLRRRKRAAGLRWLKGEQAWEVVLDLSWDKGDAAFLLWRRLGKPYLLAIGDSAADEPMFRAARGRGAAVRVGRARGSAASYWLKDVREVHRLLGLIAYQVPRNRAGTSC